MQHFVSIFDIWKLRAEREFVKEFVEIFDQTFDYLIPESTITTFYDLFGCIFTKSTTTADRRPKKYQIKYAYFHGAFYLDADLFQYFPKTEHTAKVFAMFYKISPNLLVECPNVIQLIRVHMLGRDYYGIFSHCETLYNNSCCDDMNRVEYYENLYIARHNLIRYGAFMRLTAYLGDTKDKEQK